MSMSRAGAEAPPHPAGPRPALEVRLGGGPTHLGSGSQCGSRVAASPRLWGVGPTVCSLRGWEF